MQRDIMQKTYVLGLETTARLAEVSLRRFPTRHRMIFLHNLAWMGMCAGMMAFYHLSSLNLSGIFHMESSEAPRLPPSNVFSLWSPCTAYVMLESTNVVWQSCKVIL